MVADPSSQCHLPAGLGVLQRGDVHVQQMVAGAAGRPSNKCQLPLLRVQAAHKICLGHTTVATLAERL
jgi:hypothetical protein